MTSGREMMLYAYCVTDEKASAAELGSGISNQWVTILHNESLRVVVSPFDSAVVGVTRENISNHEAVIRRVLEKTTPLPFRFGTLATAEQLGSYVDSKRDVLVEKLNEVHGCVEMSIKVIWKAVQEPLAVEKAEIPSATTGAAFLLAKRRKILGDEKRIQAANEIDAWLGQRLGPLSRAVQTTLRPSEKLVLAVSHLVEQRNLCRYQETVRLAIKERPDLHFLASGPWAPYSFVNIDLEFKT